MVLPTTLFVRRLGGDSEYPLAGLPIKHVLGVTHFREGGKGSHPSHLMIIPNTKRHPKNISTGQVPILR